MIAYPEISPAQAAILRDTLLEASSLLGGLLTNLNLAGQERAAGVSRDEICRTYEQITQALIPVLPLYDPLP